MDGQRLLACEGKIRGQVVLFSLRQLAARGRRMCVYVAPAVHIYTCLCDICL